MRGEMPFFFLDYIKYRLSKMVFYEGVIIKREFIGGRYRYYIEIPKGEIKFYNQKFYRIGELVRFSIKEANLLFS